MKVLEGAGLVCAVFCFDKRCRPESRAARSSSPGARHPGQPTGRTAGRSARLEPEGRGEGEGGERRLKGETRTED
jgi:hypothetical protein